MNGIYTMAHKRPVFETEMRELGGLRLHTVVHQPSQKSVGIIKAINKVPQEPDGKRLNKDNARQDSYQNEESLSSYFRVL